MEFFRARGCVDAIPERGALAALTVPGAVDGWRAVHERFGRLPWGDLFSAAIDYARDGMPVSRSLADWLVQDLPILRHFPKRRAFSFPRESRNGKAHVWCKLISPVHWKNWPPGARAPSMRVRLRSASATRSRRGDRR